MFMSSNKDKAKELRRKGKSLNEIVNELGISKSTASIWVRDIKLKKSQAISLRNGSHRPEVVERRRVSRLFNEREKRQALIDIAAKDIKDISNKELQIIGTMLYWAEGRKRGQRIVTFSNSDPEMIRTMMRFFREICKVDEEKFRGGIHIHTNGNTIAAEKFWSQVAQIPLKQFYKTYAMNSSVSKNKTKTLPYGTLDVSVCDVKLFLKIMGWIEKIKTLTQ